MSIRHTNACRERRRLRVGLMVLMAGVAVLLGAVGMAMLRGPSQFGEEVSSIDELQAAAGGGRQTSPMEGAMIVLAVLAIVLVVTFLVVSYALFRLTRKLAMPDTAAARPGPTPAEDVWRMHRLPDQPPDGRVGERLANGE